MSASPITTAWEPIRKERAELESAEVVNTCKAFRCRIEAVITAEGGHRE